MNLQAEDQNGSRLRRQSMQAGFWILLIAVLWTLDTLTKMQLLRRRGIDPDLFPLITEQLTSAAGVLAMVGFVAWWLNHFPIRKASPVSTIAGHLVGSVVFTLGHYTIMIALRKLMYFLNGLSYGWPASLMSNLTFEYQKDIKIYIGIVIVITVYRLFLGGENRLQVKPRTNQKILVQTGSGEAVLRYDQIDFLESARNYIVVHASNREYLVRNTMSDLLSKLTGKDFVRSHRSYAVNLNKVEEIRPTQSGHVIRVTGGREIPLSRNYRDEFRQKLTESGET